MTQLYLGFSEVQGENQSLINTAPSILYGITDKFSVYLNVPIVISNNQNQYYASGLGDASVQFEYAIASNSTEQYSEQATILSNLSIPSGSTTKLPTTGTGSPSFLIGTTLSRMYSDWYGFMSAGFIATTSENATKFGNTALYQFGIGKNLFAQKDAWVLSALVEIDGQYNQKNKIQAQIDNDSGGNVIMVTPSLWFSMNKFILQGGIGAPLVQHLYGEQNKNHFTLVTSFGWIC